MLIGLMCSQNLSLAYTYKMNMRICKKKQKNKQPEIIERVIIARNNYCTYEEKRPSATLKNMNHEGLLLVACQRIGQELQRITLQHLLPAGGDKEQSQKCQPYQGGKS